MVTSLEVISSLTIWKADKVIFMITCKVLKVFMYLNTTKNTFKCSWVLRKQNIFESGKIESCLAHSNNETATLVV